MEEVKRIYTLLSHNNGLKIKDIAKELDLDRYYVADILFSTDNIPFWYQDSTSLWFAKEGAIKIDKPREDKLTEPVIVPKAVNIERFLQGHISGALRSHLNRLSKYRVYSDIELLELLKRYRDGDKKAYDLIVKSQQKLIAGIAVLYSKYGIPLEDLIQEGNIGLVRAIERFDYIHFRNFQKFAKAWILQAISMSMTTLPYIVKLPINQMVLYRKVRKFKEKYEQQNGYLPSVNAIDIDDDVDIEKISFINKLPDSLKELTTLSGDLDIYESPSNATEEIIESEYNNKHARQLLNRLKKRERAILQAYFGINTEEETLSSIGERFDLTRERVRQVVWNSLRSLKESSGIKTEEAKIGDTVKLESSDQIGKVVNSRILPNGSAILTLKMEDGHTIGISVYDSPYEIVSPKDLKNKKSISQPPSFVKGKEISQSEQKDNSVLAVQREVNKLDDVKVGDKIIYAHRRCTICKIFVEGKSSSFLIKYDNDILDYVPNKKSFYRKALPHDNSRYMKTEVCTTRPHYKKLVTVGDRIVYDDKQCTVMEKKTIKGTRRLVVMYDDGTIDNVLDDWKRYAVM